MQNHAVCLCKGLCKFDHVTSQFKSLAQVAAIGTVNTVPVCLSDASSIFRYSMHSFISFTSVWEAALLCGGIVFQIIFYQGLFHVFYFCISCVMVIVNDLCVVTYS